MEFIDKIRSFLCFCVFTFYFKHIVADIELTKFSRYTAFDNYICTKTDTVIETFIASSPLACAYRCKPDHACFGFYYQPETQECTGCHMEFFVRGLENLTGTEYYTRNATYLDLTLETMNVTYNGYKCIANMAVQYHLKHKSLPECGKACFGDANCLNYFYQPNTSECFGCPVPLGVHKLYINYAGGLVEWVGSVYFTRFVYKGCFDNAPPRILEGNYTQIQGLGFYLMCLRRCLSEGHIYALLESQEGMCLCGNELSPHGQAADADCDSHCSPGEDTCEVSNLGLLYKIRYNW